MSNLHKIYRGLPLWALLACMAPLLGQAVGDPPPKQAVLELVEFRELPLSHAARLLSEQTGLNIVPSIQAGKTEVSLYLRNVPAMVAVETLTSAHDLWYRKDEQTGIIRIYSLEEYQRELTSFRNEETRVFTLLYPNVFHVAAAITDIYGDRVQFSPGAEGEEETEDLEQRLSRFDIIDGRSQGVGQSGGGGSRSGGGSSGSGSQGGQRGNQQRVIRRPPAPIAPTTELRSGEEAQKLEGAADAGDAEAVQEIITRGQATIFVTVIRRHNQVLVRTSDEKVMQQIEELIKLLDVPTPMVMLEVKVMAIELRDGFNSSFDWVLTDGPAAGTGFLNTAGALSSGFLFNYVGEEFIARLHLLATENRVTTLATPMLLTVNNEVSRVFLGEDRPVTTGYSGGDSVLDNNGNFITSDAVPITTLRPVGTTLLITPSINADRTVTLRILQETSSVNIGSATITISTRGGLAEVSVDTVQSRTVSGTFVAKDKLAVAIGGLIEEEIRNSEEKVPILGDVPGIGILFKRQTKEKVRRELVLMIRPYILNTAKDAERISKDLLDELSLHPNAPQGKGTLKTFESKDVLRPDPSDRSLLEKLNFHSVGDKEKP